MNFPKWISLCILAGVIGFAAAEAQASAPRDGQHDFDFTLIGAFKDGRGELFAQDTFNGRSILVRAVWSAITPDSHHFEESYSDDGGNTWAPAFIANLTRAKQ
jgi:hypothetical protein